jgi:ribosomal protein L25 (general stress protein Ctc)
MRSSAPRPAASPPPSRTSATPARIAASRSSRVPIAAKLVANMLTASGVDRVLTMDLHAEQIQGFFDIPVDNIYALPILLGDIWKQNYDNLMVVSPDHGGVVRARSLAKRLECDLAIIDKRRPKANVSEVMNIIGEVDGRTCVIMDDMVDTAGTLCKAATALKEHGASKVVAYCTHPVLSGPAIDRINTPTSTSWSSPTPFRCAMMRCLAAHPPAFRGRNHGRNHSPDQQRRLRLVAVHRLSFFNLPATRQLLSGRGSGNTWSITMQFEINAQARTLQGSGASRRLRRAGKVPGIIYGGEATPQAIEVDHNELLLNLKKEAFHSSILTSFSMARKAGLLRDTQVHAYKPLVLHVDFQRVDATHELHRRCRCTSSTKKSHRASSSTAAWSTTS